jgi:C1A family cysteine protease
MIQKHNLDKTKTYKMGITKFADMTNEEFVQRALNPELANMQKKVNFEPMVLKSNPPASVDWREKNVITPVGDQGDCGSSWSFSATGTVESIIAVKNKTLVPLSKQQLLDCCTYAKYGCEGCKGAFPDWALDYARDSGMVLES